MNDIGQSSLANPSARGRALFRAASALEETWREIESLTDLVERHLSDFVASNRPFTFSRVAEGSPEFPSNNQWVYQYEYEFRRRRKKNPDLNVAIDYRLCWDKANSIRTASGGDFEEPIVFVKGSTIGPWEYMEPRISLDRSEAYRSFGHLLWWNEKDKICWIFAVRLLSLTSEERILSEIVSPLKVLLNLEDSDPEVLEDTAFKGSREVLRWSNGEDGSAHILE